MKHLIPFIAIYCAIVTAEDVRLLDLDPNEASQLIEQKDQTLKYAPKIDSNVPALRFIGNQQQQVSEDIYLANQYHGQDGLGGYLYGYSVPDIAKTEKKKAGGDLKGAYNYITGDGKEIKVEYWDDGTGFHQNDNLDQILIPVQDTPEVKAAKEEHLRIWHEQAERNSHAPEDPNANYNPQAAAQGAYRQNQYNGIIGQSSGHYQSAGQAQNQPQYQGSAQGQGQYQSSGQYQGANQIKPQGFVQGQGQGQYQTGGQYQGNLQLKPQGQIHTGGQLQTGQYQTAGQYKPPGQLQASGQYQGQASFGQNPNNIEYSGQYTENRQSYAPNPAQRQGQEEEEQQGPPRGFFYNFDYPVGIIVQKSGGPVQKREDVNELYKKNKETFEQQLKAHGDYRLTRSASTYPNYFYIGH